VFLTIFSMVAPHQFFYVLAGTAAIAFLGALMLREPKGHMIEVHPDGRIEKISVE
jgi:NNP family nitrate/nitrite transporter-like MFS transporter